MDSALRWITDRINVQVDQVGAKKVVAVVDSHADGRLASSSLPRHISALPSVLPVFENLLSALVKHKYVAGLAESCHFISSFVTANVSVQDKFTEYGVQVVLKKVQVGKIKINLCLFFGLEVYYIQVFVLTESLSWLAGCLSVYVWSIYLPVCISACLSVCLSV